jgi:hypothetical protein
MGVFGTGPVRAPLGGSLPLKASLQGRLPYEVSAGLEIWAVPDP